MKTRHALAATALILATSIAGVSSANTSTGSIATDVQSAVGSGIVGATVNDEGLATLFGSVETRVDENAAKMAALEFPGVNEVQSSIIVNN